MKGVASGRRSVPEDARRFHKDRLQTRGDCLQFLGQLYENLGLINIALNALFASKVIDHSITQLRDATTLNGRFLPISSDGLGRPLAFYRAERDLPPSRRRGVRTPRAPSRGPTPRLFFCHRTATRTSQSLYRFRQQHLWQSLSLLAGEGRFRISATVLSEPTQPSWR